MQISPFNELICPIDQSPLKRIDKTWVCSQQHSFDIAKQGYVNLLPVQHKRSKNPGDSIEMIEARRRWLQSGHYAPIAKQVSDTIIGWGSDAQHDQFNVLDAGCGEGYYLTELLHSATTCADARQIGLLGVDISKPAIVGACKREKSSIAWVVASNKTLPIESNSLNAVISMFGFPVFEQFKRCLTESGKVLLVEAGPNHLIELREAIYEDVKINPPPPHENAIQMGFQYTDEQTLSYVLNDLDQSDLQNLMIMTPHFFKASRKKRETLLSLSKLNLTVDVKIRHLSL